MKEFPEKQIRNTLTRYHVPVQKWITQDQATEELRHLWEDRRIKDRRRYIYGDAALYNGAALPTEHLYKVVGPQYPEHIATFVINRRLGQRRNK